MREPIISLSANEEINVIGHNCKYPLRIKNVDDELRVEELDVTKDKSTVEVTKFGFDILKPFVLFEDYYQLMNNLDNLPNEIEDCLNKLMSYHEKQIYGPNYIESDYNNIEFQCITTTN